MASSDGQFNLFDLINQSSLSDSEKNSCHSFCKNISEPTSPVEAVRLLAAIPAGSTRSCLPLVLLSFVLSIFPGRFPVFELIRCHTRLWRDLPEDAKSGRDPEASLLIATTASQVKASYSGLTDLLPAESEEPAIQEPQSQRYISQRTLSRFVRNFRLPIQIHDDSKPVVVVALPNGPLLGLACIAVATYYIAAPINASTGADQFRSDVEQSQAKTVLVSRADVRKIGLEDPWVAASGISVFVVDEKPDMTFSVTPLATQTTLAYYKPKVNGPDDLGFILFTSGTSGTKKVVPIPMHNIVAGVAFVIESWGLTQRDVCLNMMPLNHVGGLIRNLFAPILAGGSTICCTAFDPNLFWDVVEEQDPTWYYASPTMHSSVLAEAKDRPEALARSQMRLICNAAGGLLPSLAIQLRTTFHCTVLPSYGMTECMPISTPPLNYALNRPGTSGVSVGPEIAILDGSGAYLPPQEVGRIGVRGAPLFPGYLKQNNIDSAVFTDDGWFDTGDMGYLDQDGYLYITGRSKEVVNRGGELISPFEVEEAIMVAAKLPESTIYRRVSECLVFSAPHDVLQEVVGVVLVTPPETPRPDLRQLHEALKISLHQPKWPFVIVYMDAVPKNNNKLQRIKLGERLGFTPLTDDTSLAARHFEATCPPPNTALSVMISKSPCKIDVEKVSRVMERRLNHSLQVHVTISSHDGLPEVVLSPQDWQNPSLSPPKTNLTQEHLYKLLDGYLIPSTINYIDTPLPRDARGLVDEETLRAMITRLNVPSPGQDTSSTQGKVIEIFASILACSPKDLSAQSDFFEMGGDSMKAGRLLSVLRKELQVRIPIGKLFQNSQVQDICAIVNEQLGTTDEKPHKSRPSKLPGCTRTYSSTNPLLLFLQLIPIGVLYPMKRAFKWCAFLYILSSLIPVWPVNTTILDRFITLLIAMALAKIAIHIVAPPLAIAIKWIVIGRFKEGMYPMWGLYHTRWWFVTKVLSVGGKGIFSYTDYTVLLYYRLLGAHVGKGVKIARGTTLGEYDLLYIGDYAELNSCVCRPFAVERNTSMYLRRITIGSYCSVGLKSFVAPGTVLRDNTCIGPASSSWEIEDASEANRDLSSKRVPKPNPILEFIIGFPIKMIVKVISMLPWMAGLIGIILEEPRNASDLVMAVTIWFAEGKRVAFHFLARALSVSVGPFFFFGMIWLVKKAFDKMVGPLKPGPAKHRSQLQKLRMAILSRTIPKGDVGRIAELFGTHYEFTSMCVRALGGKIGRRVYWPGMGPTIQDFELVEIGDNVVFGSRSHIITSDGTGSEKVVIGKNTMVADRVIILPGTVIGENAVLGSGALTKRNTYYRPDTVWVGSKGGGAICLTAPGQSNESQKSGDQRGRMASIDLTNYRHSMDSDRRTFSSTVPSMLNQPWMTDRPGRTPSPARPSQDFDRLLPYGQQALYTANVNPITPQEKGLRARFFKRGKVRQYHDPDSSPFGKAFYEGQATYHVFGLPFIFFYSLITNVFTTIYWNIAPILSIQVLARAMEAFPNIFGPGPARPLAIYVLFTIVMTLVMAVQSMVAILIIVVFKWCLMGRRKPGKYDWDTSSYCQRWQILLTIERLRRHCYGGNGIIGMLTGTAYAAAYVRALGGTVGKDCALWAGGPPSLLFTEPDLLTLGDRVAVDDASLVAHINSRGNFSLNPLRVGDRSVLRSGSRLLSGATMGDDACLLEHTLIMAGDVVDSGATFQGWPAEEFEGNRYGPGLPVLEELDNWDANSEKGSFHALITECPP